LTIGFYAVRLLSVRVNFWQLRTGETLGIMTDGKGRESARPSQPKTGWRWWAAGATFVLAAAATLYVQRGATEARLVRADPDGIAGDAPLLRFATDLGKVVYYERCASCHGPGGVGDPARGVPNLADADWLYGSGNVGEIEKIVTYGIRSHNPKAWNLAVMPAFSRPLPSPTEPKIPPLTPQSLRDVTEFVVAAAGRPSDIEAANRGGVIFSGVGGCYDCHGADGSGDSAIGAPNLIDSIWLYGDGSRQSIMDSIAFGRAGICPAWIGKIGSGEIREVSVYVYSLSHSTEPSNGAGQAGS
jgi:cytochrome c oxidase cbb3-type subunit 3